MQREIINGFRLSPHQERLWMLQQDSLAYRVQCALMVEGDLQIEVLKNALEEVINRHEILRTTFQLLPGMKVPVQVVADSCKLSWRDIDPDWDPVDDEEEIAKFFQKEGRQPFDFEHGPLLRASFFALQPNKHVLFISLPSICADSWTFKNLVREIGQSYAACLNGEQPLQYVQFSEWQHELLEDEEAETGKAHWRSQAPSTVPLRLSFDSKSVTNKGFEPDTVAMAIGRDVVANMDEVVERYNTSSTTFLMACWQVLLWRLTGQSDIVVGDAHDGRQHEILHSALGLFAKWLPIHGRFKETLPFSEVLSRINESRSVAIEWEDYFILDGIDRSTEDTLVPDYFPVGFEFEDRPSEYRANGVSLSVYKQYSCTERFDIRLSCVRVGDALSAEFYYNPQRFRNEDIQRLGRYFETLLKDVVRNPDGAVGELEILSESDRQQLLVAFNKTEVDYPRNKCIHHLFEEQADRTPDSVAMVFDDQQLSYNTVNTKANQLARYLQKLGIGPEVTVGLCVERSLEMIIGILGILKAGGTYVPLDPTYPKRRLAFLFADTQVSVLLTQERLLQAFPENDAKMICIDADWERIAHEGEENLGTDAKPEHLAYVIYTSGSTGKPKGVMIQHNSAVNLATAHQRAIYARQHCPLRISLNAPLTFDASVKQLLQLLFGHTLILLPEEVRPDGQELLSFARRHVLDVLDCTPTQLRLLLAAGLTQIPYPSPRLVLVGGEALDDTLWVSLSKATKTDFYNVYGPTECTVDATMCWVEKGQLVPTIGRPIANTKIYLLDEHLKPVPVGVPGEIHIGGAGLGRGYMNRAHLTAERFIPNPFSEAPGARLYKTGDLACFMPDDNIQFLGRMDHQVKIRGFRIELGEIEAALRQHAGVRETVAMAREDVPGDMRLVVYVVLNQKPVTDSNELRRFLREQLPEYMVPSAFVMLSELPMTRNGKVDREALPLPENERPQLNAVYVAPRSQFERSIAKLWHEVLKVDKVGIDDNFFDLGGHSLLMVQVHNRLREVFDRDISLIELFRNPTVNLLAKYLSDEQREEPSLQKSKDRAHMRKKARDRKRQAVRKRRKMQ